MYCTAGGADIKAEQGGAEQEAEKVRRRTEWFLLGHRLCVPAFAKLLGIGLHRLYKDVADVLDMRRGISGPSPPRNQEQFMICNEFFRSLYDSAAQPLALDPGPSTLGHPNDNSDTEDEEDARRRDEACMKEWCRSKPYSEEVASMVVGSSERVEKWLPGGRVIDLYWQFQAWRECS